jgi:DHA2 family methylenomycin A resistance protein-like MFS transporter
MMTASLPGTVPRSRAGIASGVLNAVRQAGGAIGGALFGTLMAGSTAGMADAFIAASLMLAVTATIAAGFIGDGRFAMLGGTVRQAAPRMRQQAKGPSR